MLTNIQERVERLVGLCYFYSFGMGMGTCNPFSFISYHHVSHSRSFLLLSFSLCEHFLFTACTGNGKLQTEPQSFDRLASIVCLVWMFPFLSVHFSLYRVVVLFFSSSKAGFFVVLLRMPELPPPVCGPSSSHLAAAVWGGLSGALFLSRVPFRSPSPNGARFCQVNWCF